MPSYAECLEALPSFRGDLLQRQLEDSSLATGGALVAYRGIVRGAYAAYASPASNIHATGIGLRKVGGRRTQDTVLKVFVFDKVAEARATRAFLGASPIPRTYQGMPVDVDELPVQRIRRRRAAPAGAGQPGSAALPQRARHRPIVGGLSIAPLDAKYVGTLGCFVRRREGDHEELLALSNNHVLADVDRLPAGTPIVQPGYETAPTQADDAFAVLTTWTPIRFPISRSVPAFNRFDAALAAVADPAQVLTGKMFGLATYDPSRVVPSVPGMHVMKMGRTTGLTRGTVTDNNLGNVQVNYGTPQAPLMAVFNGTFEVVGDGRRPFSRPGDSGSVILEEGTGHPVGLLFAGDGVYTTACEMVPLCEQLRVWPV